MESQAVSFNDFSEEVFFNCLQNLEGGREAARLAQVSKIWAETLGPGSGALWKTFGAQEFGRSNLQAPPAPKDKTITTIDFTGVDRYASLARAASLKQALWGQVQTRGFGAREGTPWLFLGRTGEDIFAFGGYGPRGPANDVMVASLTALKEVLTVSSAGTHSSAAASSSSPPESEVTPGDAGNNSGEQSSASAPGNATEPRLDFKTVAPRGMAPERSYGATVTPLVDDELPNCEWFDLEVVRRCIRDTSTASLLPQGTDVELATLFLVTGGYRSGGYRNESPDWSLGIAFRRRPAGDDKQEKTSSPGHRFNPPARTAGEEPESTEGKERPMDVLWVKPGPPTLDGTEEGPANRPTPRSNATAVYVPKRFADPCQYPNGYIMLFGGNANGQGGTNSVDVLDLSTFAWQHLGILPNSPPPRNSHSVVLMPDDAEPSSKAKVLIFGGGTGRDVPRGGLDLEDFSIFDPRTMAWLSPAIVPTPTEQEAEGSRSRPLVPGRAHVAVKVGRSVLFFGGGREPTNQLSAVLCQQLSERRARRLSATESAEEGSDDAWPKMLRSLKWKAVPPVGDASPAPRAFHAAISLAPAGVPVLLTYGGWHPYRGNFGDIWAAKLDPWVDDESSCGVGQRAQQADRRFSQRLSVTSNQEDEEDDDDEAFAGGMTGPLVNVGGRIMPLQVFAQLLRMQLGEQEGTRRLEELMQQARGGGGGGGDDDEDEDEENEDSEGDELDQDDPSLEEP